MYYSFLIPTEIHRKMSYGFSSGLLGRIHLILFSPYEYFTVVDNGIVTILQFAMYSIVKAFVYYVFVQLLTLGTATHLLNCRVLFSNRVQNVFVFMLF